MVWGSISLVWHNVKMSIEPSIDFSQTGFTQIWAKGEKFLMLRRGDAITLHPKRAFHLS